MSWYVAVLRNLTRFDEPEQVPVEIVSKLSKVRSCGYLRL